MGWGKKSPFEEGSYIEFSEYVDHVDKVGRQYFDFVLIDGRARMDCAIKALSYIDQQSVVVVHDAERIWTSKRYESVLTYYSIADAVGGYGKQGLAVLKRRKEFDYLEGEHAMVAKLLREKHDM